MTEGEFLQQFTDLIRASFENEGADFGELLLDTYMLMGYPESVRASAFRELDEVFSKYGAMSRSAYDDGAACRARDVLAMKHLEKSQVWKLVRKLKNDWPDEF